ncbi:MAG: hypothetical protein G01um101431_222 [Parcubacteria group bacterium Gr01-1014_31]|nr:MAG: hypothetical protein G01um101431_222 [Parcubacteria group bacterium Gr01-1014_31]
MRSRTKKLTKRVLTATKRVGASLVAFAVVLTQLPVIAAFEASVVNVTARITPRCEEVVLHGTKFNDLDGDGIRDAGEPGLENWVIELKRGPYAAEFDYNGNGFNDSNDYGVLEDVIVDGATCPAGTQCDFNNDSSLALPSGDLGDFQNWLAARDLGNQVTDSNGNYQFGNLDFGDYIVTEAPQNGWISTTDDSVAVYLGRCETVVDFGNKQEERRGGLSGHKFNDLDKDGVWDAGEPAIPGWQITLSGDAVGGAVTDTAGYYEFSGLNAGSYTVMEEDRDGWTHSTPVNINVTLAQGEFASNLDFGNYQDGVCENAITLDFDTDANGGVIRRGQFIDGEYLPWGIAVTAHNYNAGHPQVGITFDSDTPTGGVNGDGIVDVDLGTPNLQFGGPGNSESGDGKEPSNATALHNLLIIPDNVVDTAPADGDVDDPNDEPAGGSLRFTFAQPMAFSSVKYIDLDNSTGEVVGYADASGTAQVFSIPVPTKGGNSVQKITGDQTTGIRQLKLRGGDSYAVDEVVLCPIPVRCGDGIVNQETEQCDDGNTNDEDACRNDCTVAPECGNGTVEAPEQCDDGNTNNFDDCDNTCTPTNWCGDGTVQTPNSFGQTEQCDEGTQNGQPGSNCSTTCEPLTNECSALSIGYYRNNDGCPTSSIWADEVSVLSDGFSDVFVGITGPQVCANVNTSNCPSGGTVSGQRCRAKAHVLADEANVSAGRLRLDALLGGSDDGNAAFDVLGLSPTSTVQQAIAAVEQYIANGSATRDDLARAAYVAARIYNFYEDENPNAGQCILPGYGNGVLEQDEQCDDGNLIPWDGCSPTGQQEVVLNEVLPNPAGADDAGKPNGEWVELYNRSGKPISLAGWMLYDSSNGNELDIGAFNTDTGTTTIAAGGQMVVYRNGDSDFNLNNSGDRVRLYNREIGGNGALLDEFIWTSEKGEGNSYARVPDGTGDWVDPCPTPGDDNTGETCDGEPAEEVGVVSELPDEPEVEDAALLTDAEWDALFPSDDYSSPIAFEPVNEELLASPSPTPTPEPSPEELVAPVSKVEEPVVEPTPTPSPSPTPEPTPEPTPSPTPEPSPTPTPTPTDDTATTSPETDAVLPPEPSDEPVVTEESPTVSPTPTPTPVDGS